MDNQPVYFPRQGELTDDSVACVFGRLGYHPWDSSLRPNLERGPAEACLALLQLCQWAEAEPRLRGNVRNLYLDGFQLASVPPQIRYLEQLRSLSLCRAELERVPQALGHLVHLNTLELDDNRISTLPASIFNALHQLENLFASNNRISCLPDNLFAPHAQITCLGLRGNPILELPLSFARLPKLQNVCLDAATLRGRDIVASYFILQQETIAHLQQPGTTLKKAMLVDLIEYGEPMALFVRVLQDKRMQHLLPCPQHHRDPLVYALRRPQHTRYAEKIIAAVKKKLTNTDVRRYLKIVLHQNDCRQLNLLAQLIEVARLTSLSGLRVSRRHKTFITSQCLQRETTRQLCNYVGNDPTGLITGYAFSAPTLCQQPQKWQYLLDHQAAPPRKRKKAWPMLSTRKRARSGSRKRLNLK